mmetsp:Transcript_51618/g.66108  ORF Transcript_51618/g.66108 Transcript_51618/m.66108 type:complete len:87 (+) Transcript_51618:3-263(+)
MKLSETIDSNILNQLFHYETEINNSFQTILKEEFTTKESFQNPHSTIQHNNTHSVYLQSLLIKFIEDKESTDFIKGMLAFNSSYTK